MAVYKQNYKPYDGPLTDLRWRFSILPRYAFKNVFESRLFTAFFALSFVPTLVAITFIYLHHNLSALTALDLSAALDLIPINSRFFMNILWAQTTLTFFIVAFVGPDLISPDLTNNALPLYLSRPFTRTKYVIGKLSVLVLLTSAVTWIPGLLLVGIQASLEGGDWLWNNLRIPGAILAVSSLWILTISLLSLAISAFVKWKPVAGFSHFVVFFVMAGFGEATNNFLETNWGTLLDLPVMLERISNWLFLGELSGLAAPARSLPAWAPWVSMLSVCGVSLFLLSRKIRACEVVR